MIPYTIRLDPTYWGSRQGAGQTGNHESTDSLFLPRNSRCTSLLGEPVLLHDSPLPVSLRDSTSACAKLCCLWTWQSTSQFLKTLRSETLWVKKHDQGLSTFIGKSRTPLTGFPGWSTSSPGLSTAYAANTVFTKPPRILAGRISKADGEGRQVKAH